MITSFVCASLGRFDRSVLHGEAHARGRVGAGEILQLRRIELRAASRKQRRNEAAGIEGRDDGAILRRGVGHIGGCVAAACAGHVLHDKRGRPGHEAVEMAREQPRKRVEPAARVAADDHPDSLALIEVLRVGGGRSAK